MLQKQSLMESCSVWLNVSATDCIYIYIYIFLSCFILSVHQWQSLTVNLPSLASLGMSKQDHIEFGRRLRHSLRNKFHKTQSCVLNPVPSQMSIHRHLFQLLFCVAGSTSQETYLYIKRQAPIFASCQNIILNVILMILSKLLITR